MLEEREVCCQYSERGTPPDNNSDMVVQGLREPDDLASLDGDDLAVKTYLTVIRSDSKLGAAFFSTNSCYIYMMKEVIDDENYLLTKKLLMHVRPNVIVTSAKQEDRFLKVLTQEPEDMFFLSTVPVLDIVPSVEFSPESASRKIYSLHRLSGLSADASEPEKQMYLNSLLPEGNLQTTRCTGCLIKYLEKKRVGFQLEDGHEGLPVFGLKTFCLQGLMYIDDETLGAMQIFQKDIHPSVYKALQGTSHKEGLSVFGVMCFTKSGPGYNLLKKWFMSPLMDIDEIKKRQDSVAFFSSSENNDITRLLQDNLKHIKNVSRILHRMLATSVSISDWHVLYKTLYHAIAICNLVRTLPRQIHTAGKISQYSIVGTIDVAELIYRTVDFEESATRRRFSVRSGVDSLLDEKKLTFQGLPDLMTKVAKKELSNLDDTISECSVVYLPQIGYLLAIPEGGTAGSERQLPGLEFMFFANGTAHYKSSNTRQLDSILGDTQCEIFDQETAIMYRLQDAVIARSQDISTLVELMSELDCVLSLSTAARELNLVRPNLVSDTRLVIRKGRHLLQELCVGQFVPNDTVIVEGEGRIRVLTGPNASGKSVYLKQVGIVVYLAHVGSFVPAESALVGLTDRMLTRMHADESVSRSLSAFMTDLTQVSRAVSQATARSLVVIDEFGRGTALVDGMALLAALLGYWVEGGPETCPRLLVSTHLHGLLEQGLLRASPLIRYEKMETLRQEGDGQDEGGVVYLYRLVEGTCTNSHACQIARAAGLDAAIVRRAQEVITLVNSNVPITSKSLHGPGQLTRSLKIVEKFLQLDIEKDDILSFLDEILLL